MGPGGVNHPQDVAELTDGLLSLGGLGLSGWLPRTALPNSMLNAAIAGFQRLNNLKPDGLVNPDGPTVNVLNGYLPLPQVPKAIARAPMHEAAVLGQPPDVSPGRPITAPGMGDEALARSRAEAARAEAAMEAERRAEDPFGDIFGGRRYERNHIDDMLDEQATESRAQLEREARAGLEPSFFCTLPTGPCVAPSDVQPTSSRGSALPGRRSRPSPGSWRWGRVVLMTDGSKYSMSGPTPQAATRLQISVLNTVRSALDRNRVRLRWRG